MEYKEIENFLQNSENKEKIFKAITNKSYIAELIGKYCPMNQFRDYFNYEYGFNNRIILSAALEADRIEDICDVLSYLESVSLVQDTILTAKSINKQEYIPILEKCAEKIKEFR